MIRLTVSGPPRTKKNHNRLFKDGSGRRRVMPSRAWEQWKNGAHITVGGRSVATLPVRTGGWNCRATFYRDALRGDAVGYYQGLADLLEKRGVILNDGLIVSWDGSRMSGAPNGPPMDRANPRTEIELTPV